MATQQFTPTAEQQVALDLFATGASLAIEAGAGAGKTSTLRLLAASTTRRGQYVAFNRAIVGEAKAKMPSNVTASTAHSLAFRNYGYAFKARIDGSARMRSEDIARRVGIDHALQITTQDGESKTLSQAYLAGLATRAVVRFCQSADAEPSRRNVPYITGIDIPPGAMTNNDRVRDFIMPAVRAIWQDSQDVNGSLPYKHDYYLKGWQLSGPKINADFIMFDEAQDANPVMVAIVAAQTQAQLVWVGDSQQQIYSFTGAVNALATVPSDARAFLTQSFRFGPAIAEVANVALDALDADLRIVGAGSPESRVQPLAQADAILTRTNAAAVRAVLTAQQEGVSVHLVGGGKDVSDFAEGAEALQQGRRTSHPDLACFSDWAEVEHYVAQDEQGDELRLMVSLVNEFGTRVILDALKRMPREEAADLIVSTAHKAKGREWDRVQLAGDFPADPKDEELRLLYVAVTRARLVLDIDAIAWFGENGYVAAQESRCGDESAEPDDDADHDAEGHDIGSCAVCVEHSRAAHADAESEGQGPTAPAPREHSLEEHLKGVEGEYRIHVTRRLGSSYTVDRGNSRTAIMDANKLWRTGSMARVLVVDTVSGQMVVEWDA